MWIKFLVLWIPLTIMFWIVADGMKWKIMFTVAGAIGIAIALAGKSIPSLSGAVMNRGRR